MEYNDVLDRRHYKKSTLDLFEITAAYYTQLFYIHFYNEAKVLMMDHQAETITEGYRMIVHRFMTQYKQKPVFDRSLNDLYRYYLTFTGPGILQTEFVHSVVKEFLPEEFSRDKMNFPKMSSVIYRILTDVIIDFGQRILTNYLSFVIDKREDRDKPRVLQDEFIDFLIMERHKLLGKVDRITYKNSTVSVEIFNQLRDINQRVLKSLQASQDEVKRLKLLIGKLVKDKKALAQSLAEREHVSHASTRMRTPSLEHSPPSTPAVKRFPPSLARMARSDSSSEDETPHVKDIASADGADDDEALFETRKPRPALAEHVHDGPSYKSHRDEGASYASRRDDSASYESHGDDSAAHGDDSAAHGDDSAARRDEDHEGPSRRDEGVSHGDDGTLLYGISFDN
jgi:hypothetical protein